MEVQLSKTSKQYEEVVEAMKYATREDLQTPDMQKIYEHWADEYDQVMGKYWKRHIVKL